MLKHLFLSVLIVSASLFANAQKVKFGKIDKSLFSKTHSEIDSTAAAEILFEEGLHQITFNTAKDNYQVLASRFVRIRVYDKDRFADDSNIKIVLRQSNSKSEGVSGVKCVTYTEAGGKITETKLESSAVFTEQADDFHKVVKFAIPNVQNGCIIEYKYDITSDYYWLIDDWFFQSEYPKTVSNFSVTVPEYFNFKPTVTGYESVNISKELLSSSETISFLNGSYNGQMNQTTFRTDITEWKGTNIPAFVEEPYTVNAHEYMSSVHYELVSYKYPSGREETFARAWSDIDNDLRKSSKFLEKIHTFGTPKEIAEAVVTADMTDEQKAVAIYNRVRKITKYSGYSSIYSDKPYTKIADGDESNCADINLLLISAFRAAGLDACPVVLAPRNSGILYEHIPSLDKLNYLVARVKIGDTFFYTDATDDFISFGMLPKRALNGMARYICEASAGNIDLTPKESYKKVAAYSCKISESDMEISKTENHFGYSASEHRTDIYKTGGVQIYLKKLTEESLNDLTDSIRIKNYTDDLSKPLEITYKYKSESAVLQTGDMLFFSPLLDESIDKNPFKLAVRKYPVDFAYPIEERISMQYIIPDGWTVSELPPNVKYTLPDNAGSYQYVVQQVGQVVQVMRKFNINKAVFVFNEYANLKTFYDEIAKKEAEKIVLKKN